MYKKNSCRHTYIYSKQLPPYLNLLNAHCHHTYIYSTLVAAIPTSTQNGCCHTYIYSMPVAAIPTPTQRRLPPYLHLLIKKRRECFPIHEIGRIDGGRGFQTGGNVFRIDGNTFYDQKKKFPMKILEFKKYRIRIIVEFRRIPSGFPNQDGHRILC